MNQQIPTNGAENAAAPILCLSGGGFRATLFHLGAVRRLNELGILSRLDGITSVSGGSILNGFLAMQWASLRLDSSGVFANFDEIIVKPVRDFCADLRTKLLVLGRLNPLNWPRLLASGFAVSGDMLANAYERAFKCTLLRDIAASGNTPRFVFCATNLLTGACWQFHTGPDGKMGDFYTGYQETLDVTIAQAVAASFAFPPGFAPLLLHVAEGRQFDRVDPWGVTRPTSSKRMTERSSPNCIPLTDGGVYDNLGVEPVWKRPILLVSDAGRPFASVATCGSRLVPRLLRVVDISGSQVLAVRKRWLIDRMMQGDMKGAYWGIDTDPADYNLPRNDCYPSAIRSLICGVRTDLNSFSVGECGCLENHGYMMADAAIRSRANQLIYRSNEAVWPNGEMTDPNAAAATLAKSADRRILRDILTLLAPI